HRIARYQSLLHGLLLPIFARVEPAGIENLVEGTANERRGEPVRRRARAALPRNRGRGRPQVEARLEDLAPDDEGPKERQAANEAAHLRAGRRPLRDRRVEGRRAQTSGLVPEPG